MDYKLNELLVITEEDEKRIQDGIEKNRKGNFSIKIPSCAGKKISVKLKNHKFRFGANIFMLDEIPDNESKNAIYREKFKEVFNLATLPFYWDATEPEDGKTRYHKGAEPLYRRPAIDLCIEYCEQNGIEPREHALCYTHFYPKWIREKSIEEFKVFMERRMQEIASRYADKIPTIEVTNEVVWGYETFEFYKHNDYIEYCFNLADKYFPNNKLGINEWPGVWEGNGYNRDFYYAYIKDTISRGCRVDAIGFQYHMFFRENEYYNKTRKFYNISHLFKIMDKYSEFDKELELTEITIPAYSNDPDNEELQADIIEKLYSVWFSHPKMEKIIYWNVVDGYAAYTTPGNMTDGENYYYGGLLRHYMTEKPSFKRLKKLIKEVWTTNEDVVVNNEGYANFRGFYGKYEISVDGKTYEVDFNENGKEISL